MAAARRAEEAALDAQQQIARTTDIPAHRSERFLFAFLNAEGGLTWL